MPSMTWAEFARGFDINNRPRNKTDALSACLDQALLDRRSVMVYGRVGNIDGGPNGTLLKGEGMILNDADTEHYTVVCAQTQEAEWKKARWEGVSASMVGSILGVNKYEKRNYSELVHDYARRVDTYEENPRARSGRNLEPWVINTFGKEQGKQVFSWGYLLRSKKYPWLLATPDGYTMEYNEALRKQVPKLIECKTHSELSAKNWSVGIPEMYMVQKQTQFIVTNIVSGYLLRWSYGIKCPGNPQQEVMVYDTIMDDDICGLVIDKTKRFWDDVCHERSSIK